MEWPVSGGPARGASCPFHRPSATNAWELMRTKAAGKPLGAGAGRPQPADQPGGGAPRSAVAWGRGQGLGPAGGSAALAALPLAGKPRSRRGGGGGTPLVRLAGQSLEARVRGGGVGTWLGAERAERRSEQRAASRAAGPTPERPGASAGLESERTSKHRPRPSAAFRLLLRRAEERACASPARPQLGAKSRDTEGD